MCHLRSTLNLGVFSSSKSILTIIFLAFRPKSLKLYVVNPGPRPVPRHNIKSDFCII